MVRRDFGPRRRRRAAAVAAAVGLAVAGIAPGAVRAEPAGDLSRAKEVYTAAEAAMKESRFDDAIRDYGVAYDLSKDPALFYKLGRANERAGRCEIALLYYERYLREGKPGEPFATTTRARIAACTASAPVEPAAPPPAPAPAAAPPVEPPPTAPVEPRSGGAAAAPDAAGAVGVAARGTGTPNNRHKVAWVLSGGGIALATLGGVLAYASRSSENDIRDLYLGFAGQPATFTSETQRRYHDLIDQGHRYQYLSWAAFGLAGAAGVGAAILFALGRHDPAAQPRVAPVVTTSTAGVALTF